MAAPRSRPYFRTTLQAVPDFWVGGPGLLCPVVRFGLWPRWGLSGSAPASPQRFARIGPAVLAPEAPYSVLPFSLRQAFGVAVDLSAPSEWQGRPVPTWRGVPCRIGVAGLRLANEEPPQGEVDFA